MARAKVRAVFLRRRMNAYFKPHPTQLEDGNFGLVRIFHSQQEGDE
jgi:hypothetical protein